MSDEEKPESLLKKELDEFMSKLESKQVENRKEIMVTIVDGPKVELVSKELNHFGVIEDLFRQIGGHSSRFVLFCSF